MKTLCINLILEPTSKVSNLPNWKIETIEWLCIWICICVCAFESFVFSRFFFFFFLALMNSNLTVHACDYTVRETKLLFANCSNTVHALFIGPTITLFKKNIKNGSHGTIHTFKNYFVIVFSVFSFSKNKLYPNGPWISLEI